MSAPMAPPPPPPVRSSSVSRSRPPVEIDPRRRRGRRALPPWWLMGLDAVVLIGLGVLCTWPLGAAFSGTRWLLAAAVGLGLGVLIAFAGAVWRWGAWLTALAVSAAYLAVGSAVALPDKAANGLLPTRESLRDLVRGLVECWRQSLTLPTPLGESGVVLLVPFVLGLVGGVVAAVLVWRSRGPGLAGLVLGLLLVTSCAFGDIASGAALTRGLVVAAVGVVWLRWRGLRHVQGRWGRRALATALVVGVAGSAAAGIAYLGAPDGQRVVLRDHIAPPFDPRDYPSPLSKFRAYRKDPVRTGSTLFTVDGIESGTLVRLATMDTYDGIVWNVSGGPGSAHDSGTFRRFRSDPEANDRANVRGTITIGDYTGVWVPSVGETLGMTPQRNGRLDSAAAAELVVNRTTGTVAQIGGVQQGTTFQVEAAVPRVPDVAEIEQMVADNSVSLPAPAIVPEELMDRIQRWQTEAGFTGDGGLLAKFLSDSFREKGYYSDGVDDYTPAGHGASRLSVLTKTPTPVGNAEQYAAAMAVAGQRLGLPIRVVMGFRVPPGEGAVRGENMTAWTEVRFKDYGWVAFDPTPPEDQKLRQPNQEPNEDPQPQVLQPPRIPGEPQDAGDNLQQGTGRKQRIDVLEIIGTVIGVVLTVAQVLIISSPLWGVLLYKALRRRRRRRAADPTARLSAAWLELTDRAEDLGVRSAVGATRRERAYAVAERYEAVPVVALAHTADRHVYSGVSPTREEARAYWADVDTAIKRLRRATPWWRRVLARFSLASVPWRALVQRARARLGARARRLLARLGRIPPIPQVRARLAAIKARRLAGRRPPTRD